MYFRLTHQYFFHLSRWLCLLLKNWFTKSYKSVTTDEYLKISLPLCVSPLLWINNSLILSIIEMQGAWGDLVGFNFLVRYEYKYKPKDIRSPFIYINTNKHRHTFLHVITDIYFSYMHSTIHPYSTLVQKLTIIFYCWFICCV